MKRTIQPAVYEQVFLLANDIAQPDARPSDNVDEAKASAAYAKLLALFNERERLGDSDPFLTETLADFTDDNSESIRLYELALEQCAFFLGEAMVSKRVGLARALIRAGRTRDARIQIEVARGEAFVERNSNALRELQELAASCAD